MPIYMVQGKKNFICKKKSTRRAFENGYILGPNSFCITFLYVLAYDLSIQGPLVCISRVLMVHFYMERPTSWENEKSMFGIYVYVIKSYKSYITR